MKVKMYRVILFVGLTIGMGATATPPDCKSVGSGKYPGETCNQYYECTKTMWWYNVKSQVCPDGQIFDLITQSCLDGSCSKTEVTATTQPIPEETTIKMTSTKAGSTTTSKAPTYSSASTKDNTASSSTTPGQATTAAPPTADIPPNCKLVDAGNYPAENCNQYYQCAKTMWWYNVRLQTCSNGQIFNSSSGSCTVGTCSAAETTTTTGISTPAVTTSKPVIPPICKLVGPGNYPAENCQYYYTCKKIMWWYTTQLQKCLDGQIFNISSKNCTVGSCSSTSSSTEATTTSSIKSSVHSTTEPILTTSQIKTSTKDINFSTASTATTQATTTLKPVSPPDCNSVGPGNYSTNNCRQYYQCTKTLWWYNTELKTCPDGQTFDSSSKSCAVGSCN